MKRVVDCLYKTIEKPEDPERYRKIQKLADIKIGTCFSQNADLKKAIDILENYFESGVSYSYSTIEKLFEESACTDEEKQAFEELLRIA